MSRRVFVLLAIALLVSPGFAKGKKKNTLPAYVLSAHTVAVIIDPHAGISIDDPQANQVARRDVEAALAKWGRFDPVVGEQAADLIIVVRKGNGRLANESLPDPHANDRPGVINPTEGGVSVAGQRGPQPVDPGGASQDGLHPQLGTGEAQDSFVVYQGSVPRPLDSAPAWRFTGPDGLLPPDIRAVAAFRQAVENAEKAAAKQP